MRVHAFLATAADLSGLLDGGTAPAPGTLLKGVDPVNLASLVEIVSGGSISAEDAGAAFEEPVLSAGPRGPSIYRLPAEAVDSLGNADPSQRAIWSAEWAGGSGRPHVGPDQAVESLGQLAARRETGQALYLWVGDGR